MRGNEILDVIDRQSGAIARSQLIALGAGEHDVRRWMRQRRLVRVHPGVYVDHTGQLTWSQRAWAALLTVGRPAASQSTDATLGAALGGESAMRAACGPGSRWGEKTIEVLVDESRHVRAPDGVMIRRVSRLDEIVRWNARPPRASIEHATLDVASRRSRLDAIAVLSASVTSRMTTPQRLRAALDGLSRISARHWLETVLDDMAEGTCSALEHGYLTLVERPHGLSGARRQVRDRIGAGAIYRDVVYEGLVVELDGLQHASTQHRDTDLDRDLDTAVGGDRTVRLGWGQVFDRPCRTASRLAMLLPGTGMHACRPGCDVGRAAA